MKPYVLLALGLLACKNTEPPPTPMVVLADATNPQALNQVVCLNPELLQSEDDEYDPFLVIERHGAGQTQNGTLRAYARLASRAEQPLILEARTSFYDSAGGPVETGPTTWSRVTLSPLEVEDYTATSLSDRAAQYYIEVRLAR